MNESTNEDELPPRGFWYDEETETMAMCFNIDNVEKGQALWAKDCLKKMTVETVTFEGGVYGGQTHIFSIGSTGDDDSPTDQGESRSTDGDRYEWSPVGVPEALIFSTLYGILGGSAAGALYWIADVTFEIPITPEIVPWGILGSFVFAFFLGLAISIAYNRNLWGMR